MHVLIRRAVVIDPTGPLHQQQLDIRIKEGLIAETGPSLQETADAIVIDVAGAHVSPGWFDLGAQGGDPGYEHREDVNSLCRAAAAGGYTGVACFPNTSPAIQSKAEVEYLLRRSQGNIVDICPIGAVSSACEGKELTEMLDMRASGAAAFSDGKQALQHAGLMLRALLYVKSFNGVILNRPQDDSIAANGQMHEGVASTSLGLKGLPSLAEELMVQRDIELAAYTQSRLHIHNISTERSVELVRAAKKAGLQVSASVAVMNLFFNDEALLDFDSNFKVLPPLRNNTDIAALKAGLADGTIDCITTNHVPLEEEAKKLEYPYAKFGAIGLQTAFSAALTSVGDSLSIAQLVDAIAVKPRQLLGLPAPAVAPGHPANITVFDTQSEWTFQPHLNLSKSHNSPFFGYPLKGKVWAIVNNKQLSLTVS